MVIFSRVVSVGLILLLGMLPPASFAADISVRTDRNPVSLNQSFQLIYETSGSVDDDPDFTPLKQYLEILNQSQNSSISIINGDYKSSKSWRLSVMAREEGKITLPPIGFGSDKSPSYELTVKPASDQLDAQSDFFTRLTLDKKQAYVQQQIILTQQLYTSRNLSAYGLGDISLSTSDVIAEPLGEEKQYQTQVGGNTYLVVERSFALYPQKTGQIEIKPVMAEAQLPSSSGSFFGGFGSRGKVLRAMSNGLSIDVQPAPDQANMNPWLPAKELTLLEKWPQQPPQFVQGEPVTRTISIKADGLTSAHLPELPPVDVDGLKQYPDQPMLNDIKNPNGISGYRVEKTAFIPTRAGDITLPPINIAWWNTETNQREVASIPARTIKVKPAAGATAAKQTPQPSAMPQAQPATTGKQPVVSPPVASDSGSPDGWALLALFLGIGWFLTVVSWTIKSRQYRSLKGAKQSVKADPAAELYRQLKKSCNDGQAAQCREDLWRLVQALYPDSGGKHLAELLSDAPEALRAEVKKLDGNLYGGQNHSIDFKLIVEQAGQLIKQHRRQHKDEDLLEPLYK